MFDRWGFQRFLACLKESRLGSGLTWRLLGRLHVTHSQLLLVSALVVPLVVIAEIYGCVPFGFCCGLVHSCKEDQGWWLTPHLAVRVYLIVRGGLVESPSLFSVHLFGLLRG